MWLQSQPGPWPWGSCMPCPFFKLLTKRRIGQANPRPLPGMTRGYCSNLLDGKYRYESCSTCVLRTAAVPVGYLGWPSAIGRLNPCPRRSNGRGDRPGRLYFTRHNTRQISQASSTCATEKFRRVVIPKQARWMFMCSFGVKVAMMQMILYNCLLPGFFSPSLGKEQQVQQPSRQMLIFQSVDFPDLKSDGPILNCQSSHSSRQTPFSRLFLTKTPPLCG